MREVGIRRDRALRTSGRFDLLTIGGHDPPA
jgi:hypothetical protein